MQQTDKKLLNLLNRYEERQHPVSVDFRKMVDWLTPDRFTHQIHPYPAKLLMHIPHFFLTNRVLSQPKDTVLDPFCGSGTVLLEAQLFGRETIGADSNPIARLITKVKTQPLPEDKLRKTLSNVMERIQDKPCCTPPSVINLEYWFYPHVIEQLQRILEAIKTLHNVDIKDFFLICFSVCVRKVSLADPRLAVPVRLCPGQYPKGHWLREKTDAHIRKLRRVNVVKVFHEVVMVNIKRMATLSKSLQNYRTPILCNDARALVCKYLNNGVSEKDKAVQDDSVQLIITSPPYAGAQKYIRSLGLSLGWLELCNISDLRGYKGATIGREEYRKSEYEKPLQVNINGANKTLSKIKEVNPLRAHIATNYLLEMREALLEMFRVLKPKGYLVIVTANNQIGGYNFKTVKYLREIAEQLGFVLKLCLIDDIRSRGLMTKRNQTAGMITREWVSVFQKEN